MLDGGDDGGGDGDDGVDENSNVQMYYKSKIKAFKHLFDCLSEIVRRVLKQLMNFYCFLLPEMEQMDTFFFLSQVQVACIY